MMETKSKSITDVLNQLLSLVIIVIFSTLLFTRLAKIEKGQCENAKAEQIGALERRIVQDMGRPREWSVQIFFDFLRLSEHGCSVGDQKETKAK